MLTQLLLELSQGMRNCVPFCQSKERRYIVELICTEIFLLLPCVAGKRCPCKILLNSI